MKLLHALVTLLLSVLTPGLGQVYAGRSRQGVILWAVVWGSLGLAMVARFTLFPPTPVIFYASQLPAFLGLAAWLVVSLAMTAIVARRGRVAGRGGLRMLLGVGMASGSIALLVTVAGVTNKQARAWQPIHIETDLMLPTLRSGESVLGWQGYYAEREVRAGDVVTLRRDKGRSVARIIALPGDSVQFSQGRLVINGVEIQHVPVLEEGSVDPAATGGHRFVETLPNGAGYDVLQRDADTVWSDTPTLQVPPGKYMILLDNRLKPRPGGILPTMVDQSALLEKLLFVTWSRDLSRWGRPVR